MLNGKVLPVAAAIGAFAFSGIAMAEEAASPHAVTGNFTLTTDYAFRGVSQTNEDAAVQGGFDYAHSPTGLYAGIWGSNVSFPPGSIELDYYGGWAKTWVTGARIWACSTTTTRATACSIPTRFMQPAPGSGSR